MLLFLKHIFNVLDFCTTHWHGGWDTTLEHHLGMWASVLTNTLELISVFHHTAPWWLCLYLTCWTRPSMLQFSAAWCPMQSHLIVPVSHFCVLNKFHFSGGINAVIPPRPTHSSSSGSVSTDLFTPLLRSHWRCLTCSRSLAEAHYSKRPIFFSRCMNIIQMLCASVNCVYSAHGWVS